MVKNNILLFLLFLSAGLLAKKEGKFTFTLSLDSLANQKIIIEKVSTEKVQVEDTVQLDGKGQGKIKIKLSERFLYNIYPLNEKNNLVRIIAKPKDKLKFSSKNKLFKEGFELTGNKETERLEAFIKKSIRLNEFTDSLQHEYRKVASKRTPGSDSIILGMQQVYGEKKEAYSDYLRKEIDTHPTQFLNLMLVYGLDKNTQADYYLKVDSLLTLYHSNSQYVKQYHTETAKFFATRIGGKAPNFKAFSLAGDSISLEQYRGKYILLDFWATWCGPCLRELPHMKHTYDHLQGKNFEIISICVDKPNNQQKWKSIIASNNANWVHGYDANGKISSLYSVRHFPTLILLDPNLKIIEKGNNLRGPQAETTIKKHLK